MATAESSEAMGPIERSEELEKRARSIMDRATDHDGQGHPKDTSDEEAEAARLRAEAVQLQDQAIAEAREIILADAAGQDPDA